LGRFWGRKRFTKRQFSAHARITRTCLSEPGLWPVLKTRKSIENKRTKIQDVSAGPRRMWSRLHPAQWIEHPCS
jgi:hypothetical protein